MSKINVFLKGLLMGACDIIPGVSGGTIAFITGIYDRLISALNEINLKNLKLLFQGQFAKLRKNIDGNFLIILFLGIIIAIFTLANLITYLLINYEHFVWAFFFGLIFASAIIMFKGIKHKNWSLILFFLIGGTIGLFLANMHPINLGTGNLTMFASGAIAIIAMILPGISGSYILLMLGQYENVLANVTSLSSGNLYASIPLLLFIIGALIGLIFFSKILHYVLKKRHNQMISILIGIMIGSLYKLWPWKITLESTTDRHGDIIPLIQKAILPNINTQFWILIGLMIFGVVIIFVIDMFLKKRK